MAKKITYTKEEDPETGNEYIVREPFVAWDLATAAQKVSDGLPVSVLESIRQELGLTLHELSELLSIPVRTLARRKKEKVLASEVSERAYRTGRLIDIATGVLGSREEASSWVKEPNYALGGATPLSYMNTEPGARLVERVLLQIQYGITV